MAYPGNPVTPKLDAQRDTIWQQAEQALGASAEVRRLAQRLMERVYTRGEGASLADSPGIVPTRPGFIGVLDDITNPTRPGFIGVLDDITNELSAATDILQQLLQQVGESGRAPTSTPAYEGGAYPDAETPAFRRINASFPGGSAR